MPIRITGMNSGLDTDSIIQELVSGQRAKIDKMKKAQTTIQWKQDAWKTLNSKIYKLFNTTVNNMRYQYSYSKKTTTVSNSSAVSVITGDGASNGVQNLTVDQLAKEGYLTGAKINGDVTNSTKLSDLAGSPLASGGTATINVTVAGRGYDITLSGDDTIADVTAKLKKTGINANFDVKNQRFFVSSAKSGTENDFSITASDSNGNAMLSSLGLRASLDSDKATLAEYKEYADYYVAGDRAATLANMTELMAKEEAFRVEEYKNSYIATKKSIADCNKNMKAITDNDDYDDSKTLEEWKAESTRLTTEIESMEDGEEKDAKIKEAQNAAKQIGYAESMEAYTKEMNKLQITQMDNLSQIDVTEDAEGNVTDAAATTKMKTEIETSFYNKAEYASQVMASYVPGADTGGATKISGQNAIITLNGATFEEEDNVFDINGLTFTALKETKDDEVITVTTKDDTEGIYDMVKNFIKEYGSLISEMDKLYNADSSKGYQPLTDEEKESMSEGEIEKWEQKIKDSILRRDSTVSDITGAMKEIMMGGVEVNGKQMYLHDFGIDTLGFFNAAENEQNVYHIDGDPDDPNTSNNPDKLKAMISSDPDAVMKFFSGLTRTMYDKLNELMASKPEYSSSYTAYDDKKMKKDYDDYTKKIKEQEAKIAKLEDKWYKKFSAMEVAMAKMQSNQNALAGLLGGGS